MKVLPTQFDQTRASTAVATPTCSSCCCCCCCLAIGIATSSVLCQRIEKEAENKHIRGENLYLFIATLFIPIVALPTYFIAWWVFYPARCPQRTYGSGAGAHTVTMCHFPPVSSIVVGALISLILVLSFLYRGIRLENPLGSAIKVGVLIAIGLAAEFIVGGALILATAGIGYAILVPIVIAWISTWQKNRLDTEVESEDSTPTPND